MNRNKSFYAFSLCTSFADNNNWVWKSVNDDSEFNLLPSPSVEMVSFISEHEFCITGQVCSIALLSFFPSIDWVEFVECWVQCVRY